MKGQEVSEDFNKRFWPNNCRKLIEEILTFNFIQIESNQSVRRISWACSIRFIVYQAYSSDWLIRFINCIPYTQERSELLDSVRLNSNMMNGFEDQHSALHSYGLIFYSTEIQYYMSSIISVVSHKSDRQ